MGMRVLAGALAVTALLGQAHAAPGGRVPPLPMATAPLPSAGEAKPIRGWVDFCAREPAECVSPPSEPEAVALVPETWALVLRVNSAVNREIAPMTDMAHLGVEDRWDIPSDGVGDCEDYQLLKRQRLAEAGLPRRAMRMAVVIDETGEGHAVLVLRTDRGDLVLDNKTFSVLPWAHTGYAFVKRESAQAGLWVSLGGATAPPAATAVNR